MDPAFAFDPTVPDAVDPAAAAQQAASFMNSAPPSALPPQPMGAGTILPPFTTSSADLAAGLMARQPNAVVAVPPRPQAPPPAALPPAPLGAPAPAPVPPVAVPAQGGGGGTSGGRARGPGPDNLEQKVIQAGKDEQAGVEKLQEAKAEGNDALANVYGDVRVQGQMLAQEQADEADKRRIASEHMDATEAENIKKARDYTIPEFWKSAEGARVGSVLSVALGSIAAAITGGPNGALQTINKFTDDYFHKQKEKVDNLYKYAEQTGRLNDKTRMRYAQELTNLQAQHTAVLKSALLRIDEVTAKNQGHVDLAAVDQMKAKLGQQIVEDQEKARANQAAISLSHAHEAQAYAAAAHSRAQATAAKSGNEDKADEAATKAYAPALQKTAEELNRRVNTLKDAQVGLKDPNSSSGEVIASIESGISANSGAGVRGVSMGQLHSIIPNLVSADGRVSDIVSQQWNGKAGEEFRKVGMRFVQRAIDSRIAEQRENRKTASAYLAGTPYGKRSPDFAERTAERLYPGLGQAQAQPAPNTVVRMKDGSVAEFDASGKRVK